MFVLREVHRKSLQDFISSLPKHFIQRMFQHRAVQNTAQFLNATFWECKRPIIHRKKCNCKMRRVAYPPPEKSSMIGLGSQHAKKASKSMNFNEDNSLNATEVRLLYPYTYMGSVRNSVSILAYVHPIIPVVFWPGDLKPGRTEEICMC